MDDTFKVVAAAVAFCAGRPKGEVLPDARLGADLGLDSLDVMDLLFRLEQELAVELPDRLVPDPVGGRDTTVWQLTAATKEALVKAGKRV